MAGKEIGMTVQQQKAHQDLLRFYETVSAPGVSGASQHQGPGFISHRDEMQDCPFTPGFGVLAPSEGALRGVDPNVMTRATLNDPTIRAAIQQAVHERFLRDGFTTHQQQSGQGSAVKRQVWDLETKGAAFACTAAMHRVGMTDELLAGYNSEIHGIYVAHQRSAALVGAEVVCCMLTLGWSYCCSGFHEICYRNPARHAELEAAVTRFNAELTQKSIPLTFRLDSNKQTMRVTLQ